ncbi:MAG: tetratricopeptide repeat protein [Muribaculaceae bacterium]|nr:tetratricopeptide repeat protein [Muribaculaceae bacterium]
MKHLATVILFTWAYLAAFAAHAAEPADSLEAQPYYLLIDEAEEALGDNRPDDAVARLMDAMAVEPGNPGNTLLLQNIGVIYWREGRDSLALATFDEVLRRAPSMVTVRLNRGRLHLDMGHKVEAYEDFCDILDADSINTQALYYRGTMNLYGGRLAEAEKDLLLLKKLRPEALETAVALSAMYSLSGRDRDAMPYFEKLINEDPAPEYYAGLAGCLLALEEYSRAAETIESGLKKYPDDPELYYYRASLNIKRYRLDDARTDADRALHLGANPARIKALFAK